MNHPRQQDQNLRDALRQEEAALPQMPADLNARLMQRMESEQPKHSRTMWRWIAAAACLLLLIGIGYTLLPKEQQDEPLTAQKTVEPQTEAPKAEPEPQAEEPQQQLAKAEVQPSQKSAKKQRKVTMKLVELIPTSEAESVSGFFAALFVDLLCHLSDYVGMEVAAGSKNLYGEWNPDMRLGFMWGFSDNHTWIWGLDYAGTMGATRSRWSFESIHRFSQAKGLFVDFIWGWGVDGKNDGWYLGGDVGYNLLASATKGHWLSLMVRYDWTFGEYWNEGGRFSANLVYNVRGYFSD